MIHISKYKCNWKNEIGVFLLFLVIDVIEKLSTTVESQIYCIYFILQI